MSKYGKGWIKDPDGHMVTSFHQLKAKLVLWGLLAATLVPKGSADLTQFCPQVMDQGQTSACTGHATACAIATTTNSLKRPISCVPSPCGVYDVGRMIDLTPNPDGSLQALTDGGAMPNSIWRGVTEWGVRPIEAPTSDGRYSDCDPATINDRPTLDDLTQDSTLELMGQYQITSTGGQFITDLCLALDAGYAIAVGVFVDTAFENWTVGQTPLGAPDTNDPNGGGHYICIIGYTTDESGKRIFKFRNSWGVSWGDQGNGYGDENWAAGIDDAYPACVSPETAKAA